MNIADILRNKTGGVVGTTADATIGETTKLLTDKGVGAAVVTNTDGQLVGIISERDIVRGLAQRGASLLDAPVSSVMTAEVETCAATDKVDILMGRMTAGRFRHLPVMDDGKLVAVISIGDLVKSRLGELEFEADALKQYISGY